MFSKTRLKVLSGFFTNLSAAWFLAIFGTPDVFALTSSVMFSILSLRLAFYLEEELNRYG